MATVSERRRSVIKDRRIDLAELTLRWDQSWQSHQYEIDKYTLIDKWMRAYEKHLRIGEDWTDSFRFPELHGAVLRKFDNLVEFWPDMKVKGDGNGAIGLQATYDSLINVSNLQRERNRALMDAVKGGFGCIFVAPTRHEKYNRETGKYELFYDGLGAERIDPRDVIPAYASLVLHDHTGQSHCSYLFRRKVYFESTFYEKYGNDPRFKIPEGLSTTTYEGGFTGDRTLTDREGIEKESGQYVTVLEYWDQDLDIFQVYVNSFNNLMYESPVGIPYTHKQLPFHFYYNYRRHDSIYGVGEVELNMPYNLFKESIQNLLIDNARLELQPAHIIAGDVNFNTEETELEPGAIFTLRGNNVGKVQDTIMPFRAGGVSQGSLQVVEQVENSRITVTGDDTSSLYANPNQLATQTLAKREALQKRIRSTIFRNANESEFYMANQIISYLENELSAAYKDKQNKTSYRKIKIPGYSVIQDKKEAGAEFKKVYGAAGEFFLNKDVAKGFGDIEIELVSQSLDEEIKRDKMEKLTMFMQQVMQTGQSNPEMLQGMDMSAFLKEYAKQLNINVKEIFPPLDKEAEMVNIIDQEHDQIALGVTPEIKDDEDSMVHFLKHVEFENSAVFKKLGKKAKAAMKKHKLQTIQNTYDQKANPQQPEKEGVAGPEEAMQQGPVPGMAQQPGAAPGGLEGGGTPIPQEAGAAQPQGGPLG